MGYESHVHCFVDGGYLEYDCLVRGIGKYGREFAEYGDFMNVVTVIDELCNCNICFTIKGASIQLIMILELHCKRITHYL